MPSSKEVIERLTKQLERHILLELAKGSASLEDFIQKLEAIIREQT